MNPKYHFVLPDLDRPVGGLTIQYQVIETLIGAGYFAAPLHASRHYRYPYFDSSAQGHYHPDLARLDRKTVLQQLRRLKSEKPWSNQRSRSDRPLPILQRSTRDVFVLPEFLYCEWARLFPDAPLILAAQDVFGLAQAYRRDMTSDGPAQHSRFLGVYTTSDASRDAVSTFLDRESHLIRLPIDSKALCPLPKKFQIAYMPRKLKEESDLVLTILRERPGLADIPIVPIVNMTDEERNRTFRESLFFLSFSEREGFGLPPAEAMSAECIVIGYTGFGGNEYFTPETGLPLESNDIVGFIRTVERAITSYRHDPQPLDDLRRNGSAFIRANYKPEAWCAAVLAAWSDFDRAARREIQTLQPVSSRSI